MRPVSQKKAEKKIVALFRPIIEVALREEMQRLLAEPVLPETVDEWMRLVENAGAGRIHKGIAIRRLRSLRKVAEQGERLRLTLREEEKIVTKVSESIASHFAKVSVWLLVLPFRKGMFTWERVAPLDPENLGSMPDFDGRFATFGVTRERFEDLYRTCVTRLAEEKH